MVNLASSLKQIELGAEEDKLRSKEKVTSEIDRIATRSINSYIQDMETQRRKTEAEELALKLEQEKGTFKTFEVDVLSETPITEGQLDAAIEKAKGNIDKSYLENPNFQAKLQNLSLDLKKNFLKGAEGRIRQGRMMEARKYLEGDAITRGKSGDYKGAINEFVATTQDIPLSYTEKNSLLNEYVSNLIDKATTIDQLKELREQDGLTMQTKKAIDSGIKTLKSSLETEVKRSDAKDTQYFVDGQYQLMSPQGYAKYAKTIEWANEENLTNLTLEELQDLSSSLTSSKDSQKKWLVDATIQSFNQDMSTDWIAGSVKRGRKIDPPPVINAPEDITMSAKSHADRFNYFIAEAESWGYPDSMSNPLTKKEVSEFKKTFTNPDLISPDQYVEFVENVLTESQGNSTQIAYDYFENYIPDVTELSHSKYCSDISNKYSSYKQSYSKEPPKNLNKALQSTNSYVKNQMFGLTDDKKYLSNLATVIAIREAATRGISIEEAPPQEIIENRFGSFKLHGNNYLFLKNTPGTNVTKQIQSILEKIPYESYRPIDEFGSIKTKNLWDYINNNAVLLEPVDLGSFKIKYYIYSFFGSQTGSAYVQDPAKSEEDGSTDLIISLSGS